MRIYTLQIHNTNGDDFDEIYSFEDFQNCVKEYYNKLEYFKNICVEIISKEEPTLDEFENEANGSFKFENADGSFTIARVYDFDIFSC